MAGSMVTQKGLGDAMTVPNRSAEAKDYRVDTMDTPSAPVLGISRAARLRQVVAWRPPG